MPLLTVLYSVVRPTQQMALISLHCVVQVETVLRNGVPMERKLINPFSEWSNVTCGALKIQANSEVKMKE